MSNPAESMLAAILSALPPTATATTIEPAHEELPNFPSRVRDGRLKYPGRADLLWPYPITLLGARRRHNRLRGGVEDASDPGIAERVVQHTAGTAVSGDVRKMRKWPSASESGRTSGAASAIPAALSPDRDCRTAVTKSLLTFPADAC